FALVAVDFGHAVPLAGDELSSDELRQCVWCFENGRAVGLSVAGGTVKLTKTSPADAAPGYMPLAGGVAVARVETGRAQAGDLRMLAALIGLADLLLG